MRKHILFSILLISILFLPLLDIKPATGQSSNTARFGQNVSAPQYTEEGYSDVMMETWLGTTSGSLSANGYPASGSNSFWFCLFGDNPGLQTYNFYGEGIYTLQFMGGGMRGSTVVRHVVTVVATNLSNAE